MAAAWLTSALEQGHLLVRAGGGWTLAELEQLDRVRHQLVEAAPPGDGAKIDLEAVERLDTAGAWLLNQLARDLDQRGLQVEVAGATPAHAALLAEVRRVNPTATPPAPPTNPILRVLANLGRNAFEAADEAGRLMSFFGETMLTLGRLAAQPRRWRLTSFTHHLEQTCLNALPIVGLISFLIGVVMAYQGADQLKRFGAEIFTVDLLGFSILREIGVLLTAIVVAGRSGSAFTAQIGTMKVNEEVDALRTIGLDPIEVLVVPRLLALIVALPLLTFFADIMSLFGGGLMCLFVLDISPGQFFAQLGEAITPSVFWAGMVKAPVFAFLIAMVGCYEGLNVSGSAESVGRLTTQSVVVSIFLVIVSDALFSILFSYLGL